MLFAVEVWVRRCGHTLLFIIPMCFCCSSFQCVSSMLDMRIMHVVCVGPVCDFLQAYVLSWLFKGLSLMAHLKSNPRALTVDRYQSAWKTCREHVLLRVHAVLHVSFKMFWQIGWKMLKSLTVSNEGVLEAVLQGTPTKRSLCCSAKVLILLCHWLASLWATTLQLIPDGTPTWIDEIDTRQIWPRHFKTTHSKEASIGN